MKVEFDFSKKAIFIEKEQDYLRGDIKELKDLCVTHKVDFDFTAMKNTIPKMNYSKLVAFLNEIKEAAAQSMSPPDMSRISI